MSTQSCPEDFASSAVNNNNISATYSPSLRDCSTTTDERAQLDRVADEDVERPPGPGPVCAACQRVVLDRYYLTALGVAWHVGCLTCQHCQRPLDSQLTCFVRDGAVYCRDDYYR